MPVPRFGNTLYLFPAALVAAGCTAQTNTYSQADGGHQSGGVSGAVGGSLGSSAGTSQSSSGAGGRAVASGGALATAGSSAGAAVASGGATTAAGARATGGASDVAGASSGGAAHAGGATSAGGLMATGGVATTAGGNATAGGTKATGGTTASGGVATGGMATGGVAVTGGAPATGGIAATGGAPIVCGGTETLCPGATACTSLATDANNCGSCGHACGLKAACANSRCQPALIAEGLTNALGMDVSSKGVFYTAAATIQQCTNVADCASFTTQIGAVGQASALAVTKTLTTDLVAFDGRIIISAKYPGYQYCPITGCGAESLASTAPGVYIGGLVGVGGDFYYAVSPNSTPANSLLVRVVGASNGTLSLPRVTIANQVSIGARFAVDASYVYLKRTDAAGANPVIVACDRLSGCSDYTTLLDIEPTNMAAFDGRLYFLNGINLKSVAALSPASVTSITGLQSAYDRDMIVDGKNIYWLTTNSIVYCALPSCTGGAKVLVSGLPYVINLRSEGNYLYWLVPSGAGESTGAIYRVAKP